MKPGDRLDKYARATHALNGAPIETLRDTLCALHDPEKRLTRFCHPLFTLDVRLDKDGAPSLVTPWSVSEGSRTGTLQALQAAIEEASDGEVKLVDLMHSLTVQPCGQDVLRSLLPLRVRHGFGQGSAQRSREHLHLVV